MAERRRSCRCFDGVPANMSAHWPSKAKRPLTGRWVESLVASMEFTIRGIVRVRDGSAVCKEYDLICNNQDRT